MTQESYSIYYFMFVLHILHFFSKNLIVHLSHYFGIQKKYKVKA
jgi:hypothetical protein